MSQDKHESILSENLRQKRLQSPAHVNEFIRVTSVSITSISITCVILLVALGIWCFMGTMTDKIEYNGIVFPVDGVKDLSVQNSGIIRNMLVHNGDHVAKGQKLAVLNINGKDSVLRSDTEGSILNTMVQNSRFSALDPIVSLIHEGRSSVLAYVDNDSRRSLRKGMEVQLCPSGEATDDIGYFTGKIVSVSKYPVTSSVVDQTLRNGALASHIIDENREMYEVRIAVDTDAEGNLNWSFGEPNGIVVEAGTFCNLMTETNRRSIVEYMFERVKTKAHKVQQWVK